MKKLNLDETWDLCLEMWKWISRQVLILDKKGVEWDIDTLKKQWVINNNIDTDSFRSTHCYFCEYALTRISNCSLCPGRKIDSNFYCRDENYSFVQHPRKFYAELKRLNKIRLSKKGK